MSLAGVVAAETIRMSDGCQTAMALLKVVGFFAVTAPDHFVASLDLLRHCFVILGLPGLTSRRLVDVSVFSGVTALRELVF